MINPRITVTAWKPVELRTPIIGVCDLKLGEIEIFRARIIQQSGAPLVVLAPMLEYCRGNEGKKSYTKVLWWPSEWNPLIVASVKAAMSAYPEGFASAPLPIPPPQPVPQKTIPTTAFGREVMAKAGIGGTF